MAGIRSPAIRPRPRPAEAANSLHPRMRSDLRDSSGQARMATSASVSTARLARPTPAATFPGRRPPYSVRGPPSRRVRAALPRRRPPGDGAGTPPRSARVGRAAPPPPRPTSRTPGRPHMENALHRCVRRPASPRSSRSTTGTCRRRSRTGVAGPRTGDLGALRGVRLPRGGAPRRPGQGLGDPERAAPLRLDRAPGGPDGAGSHRPDRRRAGLLPPAPGPRARRTGDPGGILRRPGPHRQQPQPDRAAEHERPGPRGLRDAAPYGQEFLPAALRPRRIARRGRRAFPSPSGLPGRFRGPSCAARNS